MAVLAIDTSAAVAVSLTDDDGAPLASRSVDSSRHHAELLAPMIRDVLAEVGLSPSDLIAVVAGTGPAPFTGLRAGLVTARMIALAREIPLFGVSSLDALAAERLLVPSAPPAPSGSVDPSPLAAPVEAGSAVPRECLAGPDVLAGADARRREVYAARYRLRADGSGGSSGGTGSDVEIVAGPLVDRPDVVAGLASDAVVVGAGAAAYPAAFPQPLGPLVPAPAVLARLAIGRARRGVEQPAEPLSLRRPDAVPAAGRKRATG